jgi:hypothetical protein
MSTQIPENPPEPTDPNAPDEGSGQETGTDK